MKNMIECDSRCDCLNMNIIDSVKSFENHGTYLIINFEKNANLDNCFGVCEDNDCHCCPDLDFSVEEVGSYKTVKLESLQRNETLMSQLIRQNYCVGNDKEKCCDDENRNCC